MFAFLLEQGLAISFFYMFRKRLIWVFLWSALVLVAIGVPGSYFPQPVSFLSLLSPDKIVHLLLFSPLAVLLRHTFVSANAPTLLKTHSGWFAFLFGTVFGISTELLQYSIFIGRNGNVYDAIADTVGIVLGIFLYPQLVKLFSRMFRRDN